MLCAAVSLNTLMDRNPPDPPAEWLAPGIKDLLFVSVGIEWKKGSSHPRSGIRYIFHCGISVLSTRVFSDYARANSLAREHTTLPKPHPPNLESYYSSVGDNTDQTNRTYLDRGDRFPPSHAEHHTTVISAITRIY